jgi:hypothetical protein
MTALCPCGEPSPGAFLGKRCAERLHRALGDLPALIEDLDITLTRQGVTGAHSGEGKPPRKDAQPLPLHNGAAEVASNLRYVLATSVRYLTETRGIRLDGPDDPPTVWLARWLLTHHASIRLDPAGPDIASDIHGITSAIMDVVDLPKTRSQFKVGMCPEANAEGVLCPGEIWAHLPAEDLGKLATMECTTCGKVYETWQWRVAGPRIQARGSAA